MNHQKISQSDLELLGQYDTPTICNVIELFDVRPRSTGYMDERIKACFSELPPMVGYAATATFRASPADSPGTYADLERQITEFGEVFGPRVIVFEDLDVPSVAATFGEVMCTTYQAFGACGLVTSGAGRDLDQVRVLDFPVFTNGTICSHGYSSVPSLNIPVNVGGLIIQPGELLHGDRNGVTTIPIEIASEVAGACARFAEAEAIILDYLHAGSPTISGLRQAQQESRAVVSELRKRLSRA